ncbi:MAG TPA: hypothetical protein PKA06_16870, partial [Gemmatales bacterium]|nr:hypothetical protein [Gemmatales bacterium]
LFTQPTLVILHHLLLTSLGGAQTNGKSIMPTRLVARGICPTSEVLLLVIMESTSGLNMITM